MTGRRWRLFAGITSAAAVFCAGIILGLPFSSRAQQPAKPAAAAAAPADSNYVGAETCKACHEEAFSKFSKTKMGRAASSTRRGVREEANACETCHGPGKAHVDAGGGKGKGGLITFAKNDKTPVEKRNEVCLGCHTKGARLFWQGSAHESRDVACTNCHKIMRTGLAQGAARQGDRDRDLRHVPPAEAGADDALLAHAAPRGQDDLHLVPQPARHGHSDPPQGERGQRDLLHLPRGEARARSSGSTRRSRRTARTATTRMARTTRRC